MQLSCNTIDICYFDYLSDHHNRENEFLICTSVHEGMKTNEIVDGLLECVNDGNANLPDCFTDEQVKEIIFSDVDCHVSTNFGLRLDLDENEDGIGEPEIYYYAYLSWSEQE